MLNNIFNREAKAQEIIKRAEILRKRGKYFQAINTFSYSIKLDPNSAFTFYERGYTYGKINKNDLALNDYNKAIEILHNNMADFYRSRGFEYSKKAQYDLAIKDYSESIKLNPGDSLTYICRAWLYQDSEQYELAIKDYTESIKIANDIFDYAARANIYIMNNQYEQAIKDLDECIKRELDYAYIYLWRGRAYSKLGKKELAKHDFEKTLSLEPDNENAIEEMKLLVKSSIELNEGKYVQEC